MKHSIDAYLTAAVRLYGVVPLEELWKIYNRQNEHMEFWQFVFYAKMAAREPGPFILVGDQEFTGDGIPCTIERIDVVDKSYVACVWDEYLDLLEYHKDLPIRVFSREQYYAYAKEDYIPDTPQNRALAKWLENRSDSCSGIELAREAVRQAERDASAAQCLQELQRMGAKFGDLADRKSFLRCYRTVYDTTPKGVHYGHTEQELRKLPISELRKRQRIIAWWCAPAQRDPFFADDNQLMQDQTFRKVSRRLEKRTELHSRRDLPPAMLDECPCGSGLCYEICCGAR